MNSRERVKFGLENDAVWKPMNPMIEVQIKKLWYYIHNEKVTLRSRECHVKGEWQILYDLTGGTHRTKQKKNKENEPWTQGDSRDEIEKKRE